jgi:hypothetical protein
MPEPSTSHMGQALDAQPTVPVYMNDDQVDGPDL